MAAGAEGGSPTASAGAGSGDGRGFELVFHRGQAEVTPGAANVGPKLWRAWRAAVREVAAGAPVHACRDNECCPSCQMTSACQPRRYVIPAMACAW